jgi:hypothetical protein
MHGRLACFSGGLNQHGLSGMGNYFCLSGQTGNPSRLCLTWFSLTVNFFVGEKSRLCFRTMQTNQ